MNISELSIRRPVLATVLTIIILLFGFIGYNYLGVREYPSVDNPIISVSCSYPGANADVIENQITEPLSLNYPSTWKRQQMTCATKFHVHNAICRAIVTRLPYPKPMRTLCLS